MPSAHKHRVPDRHPGVATMLGLLLLLAPVLAHAGSMARIAIIIDDMGNRADTGEQLIRLPHALTFSFLPYRPFTISLAEKAHASGKEIMLHVPMESLHGTKLGKGALTRAMNRLHLVSALQSQLQAVPHVVGVNNHMGSALTQDAQIMNWFMQELGDYALYFVDSRTTAATIAEKVARRHQIPALSRDVFLDHDLSEQAIERQFVRLIRLAQANGHAVAIGHPHPQTLRVLKAQLDQLSARDVELVPVSTLIADTRPVHERERGRPISSNDWRVPQTPSILSQD